MKKIIELRGGPADGELHHINSTDDRILIRPKVKDPISCYRQTEAQPEIFLADQVFEYDETEMEEKDK